MILTFTTYDRRYREYCDYDYEADDELIAWYLAENHLCDSEDVIAALTKIIGDEKIAEQTFNKVYEEEKEDLEHTIYSLYCDYDYEDLYNQFEDEITTWYENELKERDAEAQAEAEAQEAAFERMLWEHDLI